MQTATPLADKFFHTLLMDFLAGTHRPTDAEIDWVACKIWHDSHGAATGQQWRDVPPGSDAHKQMINAALMALGVSSRRLESSL